MMQTEQSRPTMEDRRELERIIKELESRLEEQVDYWPEDIKELRRLRMMR